MTDNRLTDLEKRWKDSGSAADEAALIKERARIGDLAFQHLELAAYLNHPPAQTALAEPVLDCPLDEWISGLELWGLEPLCRAWVALSRMSGGDESKREKMEEWIACPCDGHWASIGTGENDHDHIEATVEAAKTVAAAQGEETVRNAVRTELLDWMLGYGDPVRERVAARK